MMPGVQFGSLVLYVPSSVILASRSYPIQGIDGARLVVTVLEDGWVQLAPLILGIDSKKVIVGLSDPGRTGEANLPDTQWRIDDQRGRVYHFANPAALPQRLQLTIYIAS